MHVLHRNMLEGRARQPKLPASQQQPTSNVDFASCVLSIIRFYLRQVCLSTSSGKEALSINCFEVVTTLSRPHLVGAWIPDLHVMSGYFSFLGGGCVQSRRRRQCGNLPGWAFGFLQDVDWQLGPCLHGHDRKISLTVS